MKLAMTGIAIPLEAETAIAVSAVMPCLNEEKTLGLCIAKIQRAFKELGVAGEVVVADNGSCDRSVAVAESLGARVVHESRKGYGAALLAGISAARGRIVNGRCRRLLRLGRARRFRAQDRRAGSGICSPFSPWG